MVIEAVRTSKQVAISDFRAPAKYTMTDRVSLSVQASQDQQCFKTSRNFVYAQYLGSEVAYLLY